MLGIANMNRNGFQAFWLLLVKKKKAFLRIYEHKYEYIQNQPMFHETLLWYFLFCVSKCWLWRNRLTSWPPSVPWPAVSDTDLLCAYQEQSSKDQDYGTVVKSALESNCLISEPWLCCLQAGFFTAPQFSCLESEVNISGSCCDD